MNIDILKDKYHPIESGVLIHKKFVFIHPFIDGNGRIARLLMNISLLQNGYLISIIPPLAFLKRLILMMGLLRIRRGYWTSGSL